MSTARSQWQLVTACAGHAYTRSVHSAPSLGLSTSRPGPGRPPSAEVSAPRLERGWGLSGHSPSGPATLGTSSVSHALRQPDPPGESDMITGSLKRKGWQEGPESLEKDAARHSRLSSQTMGPQAGAAVRSSCGAPRQEPAPQTPPPGGTHTRPLSYSPGSHCVCTLSH